jgi:hypothetical protein
LLLEWLDEERDALVPETLEICEGKTKPTRLAVWVEHL